MNPTTCLPPANTGHASAPRQFLRGMSILAICLLAFAVAAPRTASAASNVVLIMVDDLRPEIGAYGSTAAKTPHMDALAASGVLFERAYCNVPVCGPSRASLLTGRNPTRSRYKKWDCRVSADTPDAITLPGWFRQQGYETVSIGKIFHHGDDMEAVSWDHRNMYGLADQEETPWIGVGYLEPNARVAANGKGAFWEAAEVADRDYPDGRVTEAAIGHLRRLTSNPAVAKPFLLAVGLKKPHLPFNAPKRYWDLYDRQALPVTEHRTPPPGTPQAGLHKSEELAVYRGVGSIGSMSEEKARALIHGYFACVSYVDRLIGNITEELDRLGIADDTIIVVIGDHGWNLWDHGLWCKHVLFESSLHAPLIIRAPNLPRQARRRALVSYLDLFPTLCELSGIPAPSGLEGASLVALAVQGDERSPHDAVFARYLNGETVKTDRYRFSRYSATSGGYEEMLYDHEADPEETVNVVADPRHAEVVADLRRRLDAHAVSTP